jgi:hypothetical protein
MEQNSGINPIFARHETFHPRFGWLKKGYDKANYDNLVFSKESAPVVLGVGKNMVKAIKYWCIAFKIVDETKDILYQPNHTYKQKGRFNLNHPLIDVASKMPLQI